MAKQDNQTLEEDSINNSKVGSQGNLNVLPPQFGGRESRNNNNGLLGVSGAPLISIEEGSHGGPYSQHRNLFAQSNKNSVTSYDSSFLEQQRINVPSVISSYS
jgi:hypothetical protein